jgi:hypothetical protein
VKYISAHVLEQRLQVDERHLVLVPRGHHREARLAAEVGVVPLVEAVAHLRAGEVEVAQHVLVAVGPVQPDGRRGPDRADDVGTSCREVDIAQQLDAR